MGGTSSDGMSSYYAKNPRYGANIKYYIKEGESSIRSMRISRESFKGVSSEIIEKLLGWGYDTPRSVFADDINDIVDKTGLSKEDVKSVRTIIRDNQKKGVNIAFPGWEQLDSERNESYASSLVVIKDAEGNTVKEISGPYFRGVHEVNWDLTKDYVTTISSGSTYTSRLTRWVNPGEYTVELFKRHNGEITKISEPTTLTVERIRQGTLVNPELNSHDKYYEDLTELYQKVGQYGSWFEKSNDKLRSFKSSVKYVSQNRVDIEKKIDALSDEKNTLYAKLYGSVSKKDIGEKEPQTIFDRLSNARGGWYSSSYGPTKLHMKSYDMAKEMFRRLKPEMDAYFENVNKVGKILEEAGAPIVLD